LAKYEPHSREMCPHCFTVAVFEDPPRVNHSDDAKRFNAIQIGRENMRPIDLVPAQCPSCLEIILSVQGVGENAVDEQVIWPLTSGRPSAPPEVEKASRSIADDYNEACLVLPLSPKASAALSRRCMQAVLSDAGKTKSKNLSKQIDEVQSSLPSHIADNLDFVREIGNFAAHEQKSTTTGVILDVEIGEAEWNLDVLEALFDFYYVKPELERQKRDAMNKKIKDAGRKEIA
jgi:hypothetical protein